MILNAQMPPAQSGGGETTWAIDTISKILDTGDNLSSIILGTPAGNGYVPPRTIVSLSLQFTIASTQTIPYGHRPILQLFASPTVEYGYTPSLQTIYYKYSGYSGYKPADAEVCYGNILKNNDSTSIEIVDGQLKLTIPSGSVGWFAKSYATVSGTLIGYQS